MFSKIFRHWFVLLLIILTLTTRLIKIDWGDGHFFHPDENNMASAVSQMTFQNLDPHFYAYGQLPLFLSFFSAQLVRFVIERNFYSTVPFSLAIMSLRYWSVFFSILTIFIWYLISKQYFKKFINWQILLLFLIFNPGMIQISHFGTTESLLLLVLSLNVLLGIKLLQHPSNIPLLLLACLSSSLGLASKLSGAILTVPIFTAFLINLAQKPYFKISKIAAPAFFLALTLWLSILLSPFNVLNYKDFLSSMNYEVGVATGDIPVFYTNQFRFTPPYIFQSLKVFPYTSGLPVFLLSILGFIYLLKSKHLRRTEFILVVVPVLVYFLYNGQLYTKWTRFMAPIFFVFPFLSSYLLSRIKQNFLVSICVFFSILPGIVFLNLYLQPDIRKQATEWILKNLPEKSVVLSEAGNVVDLPLERASLNVTNFDFYNWDSNTLLSNKLPSLINESQYIIVPSRRMFANQHGENFKLSEAYYRNLFNGELGYDLIAVFQPQNTFILDPEKAEETWSVFDQPKIRVYKKTKELSLETISSILGI